MQAIQELDTWAMPPASPPAYPHPKDRYSLAYRCGTLTIVEVPFPRPSSPFVPRLLAPMLEAWPGGQDPSLPLATKAVRKLLASRRRDLGRLKLSDAGPLTHRTLWLGPRTAHALARDGLLDEKRGLFDATLREACCAPSFGAVSLIDLLVALEAPVFPAATGQWESSDSRRIDAG